MRIKFALIVVVIPLFFIVHLLTHEAKNSKSRNESECKRSIRYYRNETKDERGRERERKIVQKKPLETFLRIFIFIDTASFTI